MADLTRATVVLDGGPLAPGRGTVAAHAAVRRAIPRLETDRYLKADLDAARALVENGAVLLAVEAAIGPLP